MTTHQGEKNLDRLISGMEPELQPGTYVFASVKNLEQIPRGLAIGEFREAEGITVILAQNEADRLGLPYSFIAAWITLKVHSALEAVGLTAAFSNALAAEGISCNVIAAYFHDHIFVAEEDAAKALEVLRKLAADKS